MFGGAFLGSRICPFSLAIFLSAIVRPQWLARRPFEVRETNSLSWTTSTKIPGETKQYGGRRDGSTEKRQGYFNARWLVTSEFSQVPNFTER